LEKSRYFPRFFRIKYPDERRTTGVLAPGPETVDEVWRLSKDSADAATAQVRRKRGTKKQNKNCNKAPLATKKTKDLEI